MIRGGRRRSEVECSWSLHERAHCERVSCRKFSHCRIDVFGAGLCLRELRICCSARNLRRDLRSLGLRLLRLRDDLLDLLGKRFELHLLLGARPLRLGGHLLDHVEEFGFVDLLLVIEAVGFSDLEFFVFWLQRNIAAFGGESSEPASLDELLRRFDRGDFDLVAVGRALISDPDWAVKVRDGRMAELSDFSPAALASLV